MPKPLSALSVVAPPLAAELGFRLWGSLGAPASVHERDRLVHESAVTGELEVSGERVVTYRWGSGPRVILLVHGWRSRASRFGALIGALAGPDRTILSFDAPGNGDSTGSRVTVLEYADAIRQLGEHYGGFDVIIGHSFGVLSTFVAVREGVSAGAIVDIAGMYDANQLVDEFCRQAGITGGAKRGLRRRIERRTFPQVTDPWRRFVAELEPTTTHIPLLVIHDADDPVVSPGQADLIAASHTGEVTTLRTHGLGHSKILGDPGVLSAVADFVAGVLASGSNTRTRS